MKVLHIIPSISPLRGGPSKAVIEMVTALRASNIDAVIATTNDNGETTLDVTTNQIIDYQSIPVIFFKRYSPNSAALREFAYSAQLKKWLSQNIDSFDLVHIHAIFSFSSTYAMWLCRKRKVPYITRTIGQLETWSLQQSAARKKLYLALIERKNLNCASCIQFTSESEKSQASATVKPKRTAVLPLGVNLPALSNETKQTVFQQWQLNTELPVILFLSRLHPKKGLEIIIDAISELEHPVQLVIAGSGDAHYEKQIRQRVTAKGIENNTVFTGFVEGSQKQALLQYCDLFVLPSHSENFGIAAVEAMAAGAATLISKQVAVAEYIEKHQIGYLCDTDKNSVKAQLSLITHNQNELSQKGSLAREFVRQNLSWEKQTKTLVELYNQLKK